MDKRRGRSCLGHIKFAFSVVILILNGPLKAETSYYLEESYQDFSQSLASSKRLRYSFDGLAKISDFVLRPYIQSGEESIRLRTQDALGDRLDLDPYSHLYVTPGLQLVNHELGFFLESRYRHFFRESSRDNAPMDFRLLGVWNSYKSQSLAWARAYVFQEIYSEAVVSSVDKNNLTSANFLRYGMDLRLDQHISYKLYLEPYVTADARAYAINNRAELRLSTALAFFTDSMSFNLSVARNANYSWSDESRNLIEPFSYRILFAGGGYF